MAAGKTLNAEMLWCSEIGKHPSRLLSQRFPWAENYGNITEVDWSDVPRVDILTGGYPCQPFSNSGLRKGNLDERHLWPYIRQAVRSLRPGISIFENVSGHRGRGFADVLCDCAEDGFDVRWVSVRASDAGAPHARERLYFVVADTDGPGFQGYQLRSERHEPTDQCSGIEAVSLLGRGDAVPWGDYEAAIRRWGRIMNRPAPAPTEPNKFGRPRLSAAFHEWMMGLPEGWVTHVDIPYSAKIQLTGNGVVPQQAEYAIKWLLRDVQ